MNILSPQKDAQEVVAIKCVAKKESEQGIGGKPLTEIEILKGIQHPHIVQPERLQVGLGWG